MNRALSIVVGILTTAFCLAWQQPAVPSDTPAPSPTDEAVLSEYKKFVGHWKLVDATRKEVLPQGVESGLSEYRIVDGRLIKRYAGKGHLGNLLISLDISDPAESGHRIMMTENNPFRLKQSSQGLYIFEKADPAKGIPERLRIVFNDKGGYPDSIGNPNTHVTIYERVPPAEAPDHFKIARADGQVVISLSADNRKAMGYTGNTAEGVPLELDPNVSIQPAVEAYQQYGIVQHGPHQHVFSGRLRQWVMLTLPEPGFPEPMQRDGMIELTSPSKGIFTYDDSVGRWMTTEELKSQALARLSSVLHPGANTAAGEVRTISSGESAKSYGETQRTDHKPATNAPAAGTIAESQTQMTASQANTAALDRLEHGDVLGVTIEGVLGPPRVADSGKTSLNGFPVTIGEDGEIALPFIPPLKVEGLTLVETREAIRKAYTVDQQILVPGKEWINLTVLRRRADATPNVKVVTLKYAQATEVAEVLKQVYDKGPAKIVPDARTNSVIVTGPEAQLQEIEALLLKLDEGPANPNASSVPSDPVQSEAAKLVVQLEDELAQLQQSVGANHPKVKELQGRIAAARQNVQSDAASSLPGTPATNVNPLGEIEHLDAEGERLRQRLEADKKNLERTQALMKEGGISSQKAQEAEAPVQLTEALLAAHEAQRSAVLQKFKAQLLKALDDALEYFQSSGQIEKAELQDAEKQIEAIITQVDTSPKQALTAANDLISQLDSELMKQLEKAIKSSPTDPQIGTWQTALRQAQRRARTRKLLPGSLLSDRDFLDGAKALSSTESVVWTSILKEIISELEKEREAEIERNLGKHSPRVDDLNAFIAQIKAANADHFARAANEQAKAIAELKETGSLFSASLAKGRAEREQLLTTDPTNPRIRKLDEEIATLTVMQRNYAKAIAAAEAGAGSKLPESAPLGRIVSEGSPQELQQQIAQLRKEYEAADSEARQLARQLQTATDEARKNEALRADLRRAVQRAFAARQSLLRAELLEMHDKLLKTQRSIDLRERISDQIIQRRVEDLLNPQLEWEGKTPASPPFSKAADAKPTDTRRVLVALNDIRPGERLVEGKNVAFKEFPQSALVTYNGDLVQSADEFSIRVAVKIAYEAGDLIRKTRLIEMGQFGTGASAQIPKGMRVFTFQADATHIHSGLLRPGDKVDVTVTFVDRKGNMVTKVLLECIEVFATEINAVHSDEDQNKQRPRSVSLLVTPEQDGFVRIAQANGQLGLSLRHPDDADVKNVNGINSAIMEDLQRSVGEEELPHPSGDDESRWRSAVVEILVSGKSKFADIGARKIGFGTIVAADGTMITQLGGGWSNTIQDWPNLDAQFDDGSIVPLQVVDEGGSGFVVLRPRQKVTLNHHFPLSQSKMEIGDEVYVGQMVLTSLDKNLYEVSATAMTLSQTERRVATLSNLPVWQLTPPEPFSNDFSQPVLDQDGELLALTLVETGGLVLAVPVDKLREIMPDSLRKLPNVSATQPPTPEPAKGAEVPTDPQAAILAKLQGDWSFKGQPVDKDEPQGLRTDVNIKGDLMTVKVTHPDGRQGEVSHQLKLGEAGPPQQIDVIFDPNGGTERMECKGIIEIDAEVVRICVDNSSDSQRPEVFAAGSSAEIWELRRKPAVTELEGDWHLVATTSPDGKQLDFPMHNLAIRGNRFEVIMPTETSVTSVVINEQANTIAMGLDAGNAVGHYVLTGDRLTIRHYDPVVAEYQRGHVTLPKVISPATEEQMLRWRSGIVEIIGENKTGPYMSHTLGHGTIVSSDGVMISQVGAHGKDAYTYRAKFDDGSLISLKVVETKAVEDASHIWMTFEPAQPIEINYHFRVSSETVELGDQVYLWGHSGGSNRDSRLDCVNSRVSVLDRKYPALGVPVWQLDFSMNPKVGAPILDAEGNMLGMLLVGTGDLLLAIPVEKLREILPESLGKLSILPTKQTSAPEPAQEAPTDSQAALLAKLQGIWDVEVQSSDLPKEKPPFKIIAEIRDNVMTWSFDPPQPDNDNPPVFQIKLGELGTPQSVDLVSGPNDGEDQRTVLPGIMEVGQDQVRICVNVNSHGTRPEVLVAGKNVDIYTLRRLSKQSRTPQPAAKPEPDSSQAAMLAKLQGRWHLTIHPTSVLGMGLFLKDSEEAEAVIEGQVMKVFYKKALGANLLEDDRDPFLADTVKVTFGETGSPQPVDLLFGPNEEPVNRRLALGIAEFSDDVIRLCFDRATESESIRPEVFAVGAKGEIWELRREPPTGSRGYVLDRLQGVWQGTWKPDFTLPAGADVPTIDGIVQIQGSRMAVSWQPDEEIEVRLGASGSAQNIDLLFKDRKTKATNELLGVVDASGEEIVLRLGDCNEEDRPKSIVGTKDEATFTLKLSKLPPGTLPDLGAQCELAGPLPQGAGQGKFRGGLRIAKVFAGTPAAEGGLASGDILVGFHVWEITRLEELQYALAQKLKGEVSFHVIRSGVVRKGYVLLDGSRRPDTDSELSPDQLTSIPVEYDRGIAIPAAQLQEVLPNTQER